jgi:hypothetical protein
LVRGSVGQGIAVVSATAGILLSLCLPGRALNADDVNAMSVAGTGASPTVSAPANATVPFSRTNVGSAAGKVYTETGAALSNLASTVEPVGAHGGPINDPASAQKFAAASLGSFGWGQDQMTCLVNLWTKESDWKTTSTNMSSFAYGIAQALPAEKMASAGVDWRTNYETQIRWGLGYIKNRYGSPCGAWTHEVGYNWY